MIAVKGANRRVARDPGKLYGEALARHQQMEAELLRAQNRWQKSRQALHRLGKRLDKAWALEAEGLAYEPEQDFNDTL